MEKEKEKEHEVEEDDIPDLTSFSIDKLSQRYESVVTELYSGKQCSQCSMRFKTLRATCIVTTWTVTS